MSTKTTPTPNTAPISTAAYIDARDAEAVAAFHTAKAALLAAQERAEQATLAAEDADLALDDLQDEAMADDSSITPAQHAEALSALRLSELAVKGAQARLRSAEKALTVPDKAAAEVVAHALREYMPGVTIIASIRDLGPHTPSADELPMAVVVTDGPSEISKSGAISGDCKIKWFRSHFHVGLDPKKIEEAAENSRVYLKTKGSVSRKADGTMEEMRVRLNEGILEVPYITNVSTGPKNLSSTIVTGLAIETAYRAEVSRASHTNGAITNSFITVLGGDTSIVSNEISDECERALTVDVAVMVETHKPMPGRTVTDALTDVVGDLADGAWLPGLGRISSIEFVSDEETTVAVTAQKARAALRNTGSDLPTNAMTVGYESISTYYLRVVARSTTEAPVVTAA